MGLLGNQSRFNFGSGYIFGSVASLTVGANSNTGEWIRYCSKDGSQTYSFGLSSPTGYANGSAYNMPQKGGELSTNFSGLGSIVSNLIPSRSAGAAFTGSGSMSLFIQGRSNMGAVLTGTGSLNATIAALGSLLVALSGSGDLDAVISGGVDLTALLSGSGTLTASSSLVVSMGVDLSGVGDMSAAASGGIQMFADIDGIGSLAAVINGRRNTTASMSGYGSLDADLFALGNMLIAASGSGDLEATVAAIGDMFIDIAVTGSGLTVGAIADAVHNYPVEGSFTFQDVTQLVAAILAGKTTIVDNGSGSATVTFRNISDTEDKAVFDMQDSERIDRTD